MGRTKSDPFKENGQESGIFSFVDRNLIPYKLFYFLSYAGYGALFAYLPLYLKQFGLQAVHAGLIVGVRNLVQMVASPFWGALADKYKRRKLIIIFSVSIWTAKSLFIMMIQPKEQKCSVVQGNKSFQSVIKFYDEAIEMENIPRLKNSHLPNNHLFIQNSSKLFQKSKSLILEATPRSAIKNESQVQKSFLSNLSPHYSRLTDRDELKRIFLIVFLLSVFGELLGSAGTYSLVDSATVEYLGEQADYFGQVRMFSHLGLGFAVCIVGIVVHHFQKVVCGEHIKNYIIIFYFFAGFMFFSFVCSFFLKMVYREGSVEREKDSSLKCFKLFGNIRLCSVMLASTSAGMCFGLTMNFNLWFLNDLGVNSLSLGIAGGLHYCLDVLMFFLSKYIMGYFGHIRVIGGCLTMYTTSFLIMSYVKTQGLGMAIYVLQGGGFGLCWSTVVAYVGKSSIAYGKANFMQGEFTTRCKM